MVALGTDRSWSMGVDAGNLVFRVGSSAVVAPAPTVGWNHIGVVKDHALSEIRMYLNGELHGDVVSVIETLPVPDEESLWLARSADDAASWPSAIDELRFASDVMHTGMSTEISSEEDTAGWAGVWHFNDLSNVLTGGQAIGDGYEIVDSCPQR